MFPPAAVPPTARFGGGAERISNKVDILKSRSVGSWWLSYWRTEHASGDSIFSRSRDGRVPSGWGCGYFFAYSDGEHGRAAPPIRPTEGKLVSAKERRDCRLLWKHPYGAPIQLAQAASEITSGPPRGGLGLRSFDSSSFGSSPFGPSQIGRMRFPRSRVPAACNRKCTNGFPWLHPGGRPCYEDIDRHAALAGYLKSRLQLHGDQKIAWRKTEQSSEPVIDKMRKVCAQLPTRMTGPPTFPEALDFLAERLSARAELLRSLREPMRDLYESLSPDRRAALIPFPVPGHAALKMVP
jgi:hypothetical protein